MFDRKFCAGDALVPALARDPRVEAGEFLAQGLDLAHGTALLMSVAIEAEQPLFPYEILDSGWLRQSNLHVDAIALAHRFDESIGFRMQTARVQRENGNATPQDRARHVDQHDVFRAAERDGDPLKTRERILKQLSWRILAWRILRRVGHDARNCAGVEHSGNIKTKRNKRLAATIRQK